MLTFKCSACKKTIVSADSLAGQQGECPFCMKVIIAPGKPKLTAAAVEKLAKSTRCEKCGAKKKSGEKCASCGGAKTRRIEIQMPELDRRQVMILGGIVAAGVVVAYMMFGGGEEAPQISPDEQCRRQMLILQTNAFACPGGPPDSIGSQFWFDVAQKNNAPGLLKCPGKANKGRRADYRGPAKPFKELRGQDVLAASFEGNHPGGVNILFLSGEIAWAPQGSELYNRALSETKE